MRDTRIVADAVSHTLQAAAAWRWRWSAHAASSEASPNASLKEQQEVADHVVAEGLLAGYHDDNSRLPTVPLHPANARSHDPAIVIVDGRQNGSGQRSFSWEPILTGFALDKDGNAGNLRRQEREAEETAHTTPGIIQQTLVALGGGTGAAIGGTHSKALSGDLERRMRYQDNAVIILLLIVYLVTISFGLSFTYWQASNRSPVTYYADPRFYNAVTEGHDLDNFLDAFSQSPKQVQLQVTGFLPVPEDTDGSIAWQGAYYHVAFTFALDLSLWVVQENAEEVLSADGETPLRLDQSIVGEDLRNLRHFLAYDQNDLAMVEIEKNVAWPGWEELAMNIKHQIRQRGFAGITSIRQSENEHLIVYKNKRWANFLHSRMTKALCALSLIGWLVYLPYMWLRCTKQTVRVCYKIETTISDYWNLISEQLSANGFGVSAVEY